ncbi:MAG TPA: histidine kinase dimerization/phosphoacceptor domain -containing protein [Sphingomicrobium sp.]|jgi:two-component sensor histidine kinase
MSHRSTIAAEDLLITDQLYRRSPRAADLETELAAYRELSSLMAVEPVEAIQRFLDLALELCPAAGSAGLSELPLDGASDAVFTWTAMSGAFAPYVGGTTPRDFSPCGLCLDHHHTILVERPGRVFTYFNDAEPEIIEGLIVPLYDTGKRPIGTLWVTSHEYGRPFDATDARVMEQLAVQLVLAIKLRRKAALYSKLEEAMHDKDVLVHEVRHRVKNMIQMTSALLVLQERGVQSGEARSALREAQNRLLVLASVYEALLLPDADARRVDLAALIKNLAAALKGSGSQGDGVEITTDCDEALLGVSHAVPVGLFVNEAITNALKHAFNGRSSGRVDIQLRKSGTQCVLVVRDDGSGFDTPARKGSLGMRLMKSLARQVGGRMSIDGASGTTVRLEWECEDDAAMGTELSHAALQPA